MPDTQCFACLSFLHQSEVTTGSRKGIASTLNNFQNEIKDLMKINGRRWEISRNKEIAEEQLQNLAVCLKCLNLIKSVIISKQKVDRVENTVRKLQLEVLKQLKNLEKCLEGLRGDVDVIGGIIQDSGGGGGGRSQTADHKNNGLTDDGWIFRKNIIEVNGQLQLVKNGIRDTTSITTNYADGKKKPWNSVKIKSEPETNDFNLNVDEDSNAHNLHLMRWDDDDDDQFESLPTPSETTASPRKRSPPKDHLQETVSCPHCQETLPRQLLRTHKLHHCPSKKNRPLIFPCTICKEDFLNADLLKNHNLRSHREKLKWMCKICGKISVSTQSHHQHQLTHENPRNRETVECEDCGKIILTTSVNSHKRLGCSKRENKWFLCNFCQNYFSNYYGLRKHVRLMHKGQTLDTCLNEGGGGPPGQSSTKPKRKIKVIAEEDNYDNLEDKEEDKCDEEVEEDSSSDFIPSEGENEVDDEIKRMVTQPKIDCLSESTQCSCCKETMPRKLLRTHLFYHCPAKAKDIIYSCTLCKPSLDADDKEFQQPIFQDLEALKSHVAKNHPQKMLSLICDICGRISGSMDAHLKHQVRHVHPKDREFVECEECGKSVFSTSISSHRRFGCPKRERSKFPCIYCPKMFSAEMGVVRHVSRWHKDPNGELRVKPRRPLKLQCHLCGKWIQDKGAMKRHLRSRHVDKEERDDKVVCQFCGKEMLSVSLGQHEKFHCRGKERGEGEKMENFTCDICGKGFGRYGNLVGHKKVVHGNERFECEICGRIFKAKTNYKKHLVWHKGLRRFECELGCGARFKVMAHLKRHLSKGYCQGDKGPRRERRSKFEVEKEREEAKE